jgi:hypothetical protein
MKSIREDVPSFSPEVGVRVYATPKELLKQMLERGDFDRATSLAIVYATPETVHSGSTGNRFECIALGALLADRLIRKFEDS